MIVPKPREPISPQSVQLNKLLLVEGDTPAHFFEALAKHLGLEDRIEIRNFGGIKQLGDYVELLASTREFKEKVEAIGVVRDAEENPAGALEAATAAVMRARVRASVRVRYFILPDNKNPGMIETLCLQAVASEKGFECIDRFFDCAMAAGVELPPGVIFAKNRVQAYLALRKETQMMPGIASYKRVWPFDHIVFAEIKAFLQAL